jgi:hypothetical protein
MDFEIRFPHHAGEYTVRPLMTLLLLLLEAGVALALLLGIVWWTWPRQSNEKARHGDDERAARSRDDE